MEELLDELSKGRAKPMSYSALSVHMTHLRRKGYAIKRQVVYSIGGLRLPDPFTASDGQANLRQRNGADRQTRTPQKRRN